MSYVVTKSAPSLVPPAGPTPTGSSIPLSSIDKTAAVRVSVDFIQVFLPKTLDASGGASDHSPAKVIKEGFAKALVAYYPVAGKIVEPTPGEPEVELTGEGIWFVEATANCSLADVNELQRPLQIPKEELLPRPPPEVPFVDVIFMAQVTEFTCGGYSVGICFSHLVFDGQGAAQFVKAAGEMARGLPEPTIKPVWDRETIPNPPKPPRGPPPSFTAFNFVTAVIDITLDNINRIKDDFTRETGQKCSTFDVASAFLFKYRTLAISQAPTYEVRLGFAASTRHLLHGVLPKVEGYYGNCVYPVGITRTSEEINKASIVEIVSLMKDAKDALTSRFVDWMNGGLKENHYNVPLDYGTLTVSDWSRVGFNEVNYGWGEPNYVFTLNDDVNIVANAIYLKPPAPKQGIRLMLRCVEEQHSAVFVQELSKFA